ncbi:hypothetical protein CAI21_21385 [Alkalilimnicola ehrlichii]|uniref:AB hydrolase-1 domain-containing protein n=1 Tax=Alkalilimnicola ehrlichii TaxID=351052 RepID=A0A3E0WI82_9GAMM|nr:alpha/beta hydrolase [Alkalilimnicola ehrlichii]RFA24495.1 hypothetical protein CAI21_21385 [Alkalilimnicola ehrlichii]RFA32159.1 hypothetical protein CAL65_20265 [Alkalilimnicola ehrlichii]
MRIVLLLGLIVLLSGCNSLGLTDSDPERVVARYATEASDFIEVDGARVHVQAEGEGPAVVLLHGVLASLHTWDDWADALREDYRVIRIDVPPFGLSEPLSDEWYDGEAMAAVLDAVLDHYRIDSAVFAGNSLGGYYAAYYAAKRPERVQALTLISPAGYPQPLPAPLRLGAMPVVGKSFELAMPRFTVRGALMRLYAEPERVDDRIVERYFLINRLPGQRSEAREVMRQMVALRDVEPEWVADIKQPTLLLWGEQDQWVKPELAQRWLADLAHGELIVYPDAGHVAMEEIPARTVADFRRFLADVTDAVAPETVP